MTITNNDIAAIETLSFETREQYFAWRSTWRTMYREISQEIREAKRLRKIGSQDEMSQHQSDREMLRRRAARMMEIRMESKTRAAEQRQSRLVSA